jgi:hypothetical protein
MTITPLLQAFLTTWFSAVGEIGNTTMASAPAWTIELICWIWRWAFGPATWICRSTLSRIDGCAAMALTMLAASACQSLPM